MDVRRLIVFAIVCANCLAAASSGVRTRSVTDLLDRYAAGDFDRVVSELEGLDTYQPVLTYLREHGRGWIDQKGAEAAGRRELAAATFALEAARAGQWHEWKIIRKQPRMCAGSECYTPPDVLRWQPPALILEWGCQLLRQHDPPKPIERWWQLAAVAVAQRSEDPQFLIGDVNVGRGPEGGEIGNTQDEIKHLEHAMKRFPKESRVQLAYGIAQDRDFPLDAAVVYRTLESDPDVGGEAMMRLGAMLSRRRSNAAGMRDALQALEKVHARTRDPYVVYLAHYFAGRIHVGDGRIEDAEEAFRRAAAAVPQAQSAQIALAALVFRDGRRTAAQEVVRNMLDAGSAARDPWRTYVHADDRFWPRLIGRLRAEISR
jgi:hypothetical protein